ncbi:TetR/AcrR family transcriptional regulator [uncultured Williamsia sp.]|uniref:TetR/AcrR family transcriptional regulator n=1 Tax=uncultured Williamsia sp. TaxID=259311 RepID=UPI002610EBF8|nr:TetR/AcrR family transcriptional regulator [uncultured Williamsia sp.]
MRLHGGGPPTEPSTVTTNRERNADATRAALLQAAKRRFTVYGFERTTVREIAADAGANVSLINRYFGSKDGLLAAVVAETANEFDDRPTEGVSRPEAVVDQLLSGLRPEAWPEFGHQNPLLLLVRDAAGDEATADLRRRSLAAVVERFAIDIASTDDVDEESRVRGAVLFALMTGVVTLHSALPDTVFADLESTNLRTVLTEAAEAITRSDVRG